MHEGCHMFKCTLGFQAPLEPKHDARDNDSHQQWEHLAALSGNLLFPCNWAGTCCPRYKVLCCWNAEHHRHEQHAAGGAGDGAARGQGHGRLGLPAGLHAPVIALRLFILAVQCWEPLLSGNLDLTPGLVGMFCCLALVLDGLRTFVGKGLSLTLVMGLPLFHAQVNAAMYINSDVPGLSQANQPNTKPLRRAPLHFLV